MAYRQVGGVFIRLFPSPILGHPISAYKHEVDLAGVCGPLGAVPREGPRGDSAVASPTHAPTVFVHVFTEPLEHGLWTLEYFGDNIRRFMDVRRAAPRDGLEPVV